MDERKLLIADDSELNRAILVSVLEKGDKYAPWRW